jgi:MinD-like ATPase involved in chromosome partitioning or flagellar assembly
VSFVAGPLKRRELYPRAVVDGRPVADGAPARWGRRAGRLLTSAGEREEAELERAIRSRPGAGRANTLSVISPKGGVGKTTVSFLVGSLLASHLQTWTIAVDTNPDYGTLGDLAPEGLRSTRSLADLLDDMDQIRTAAQLRPYVTQLPTGLHVLSARRDAEVTAGLSAQSYGELLAFLSIFYELVVLDCGTGVGRPLARFAIDRADQVMLLSTAELVTANVVLSALHQLRHDRTTLVLNRAHPALGENVKALEDRFRRERVHRSITLPDDPQLATMLDTGTYALEALARPTRLAIKRLGLAAAEQFL